MADTPVERPGNLNGSTLTRRRLLINAGVLAGGVMLAGPRISELTAPPPLPTDVLAYGQPHAPSPAHRLERDPSIVLATDNWPFLYMRAPDLPRHYVVALALVLFVSALAVWFARGAGTGSRWSWHFFFLGAGFMLLETKSIVQFALLWGRGT